MAEKNDKNLTADTSRSAALWANDTTEVLNLSAADQKCLAEALLNPPGPNDALKRSIAKYKQHILLHKPDET